MTHLSASFSATHPRAARRRAGLVRPTRPGDRRGRRLARRDRPRARRAGHQGARRHGRRRRAPSTSSRSSRPCARSTGIEVERVSDRTFLMHLGGKIEMTLEGAAQDPRRPLDGLHARGRAHLHGDRRGSRLGLGPHDQAEHRRRRLRRHRRARPRRHRPRGGDAGDGGQGVLFKEFGGVDACPICLATKDVDEIVAIVQGASRPAFGGINLEDISAPRCFEIERAAEDDARHPRLPRRPARHRDRGAGGAAQRAEGRRQADRGRQDRDDRASARPASRSRDILLHAGARNVIGVRPQRRGLPRAREGSNASRRRSPSGRTPTA